MSEPGESFADRVTPQRDQLQETLASAQASATEIISALRIDQQERWRQGERVPVEEYISTRPELSENREGILDLVLREVTLREEAGEHPEVDEYARRFPDLADELRQQFAVRAALREQSSAEGPTEAPSRAVTGEGPIARVRIDGYEILKEIGRGGMGVVYKARQLKLNRMVAIKMVLAGVHAGAEGLARFKTEAEAAAQLQHPNIVQIYEISEQDGHPFFTLEFVEGQTLEEKYGGKPMEARQSALLVETLARAMQAAHERGIIHRDLKPANILIAPDGTPKITDFGLAKRLDSNVANTRTGDIMGTPSYMAPEQAAGRTKEIGPATDIYALGAILYDLLTGRPPFQGASLLDTLEQVRNQEPVPPRRFQIRLPTDLETIVLKCLEKEPEKRYASAGALADDLQKFMIGEPIAARPISKLERGWRWCKRNPALASASGLAMLAAVAALIFSINLAIIKSKAAADSAAALEKSRQLGHRVIAEIVLAEGRAAATAIDEMLRQCRNDVKQVPEFPPIPGIIRCWDNNGQDPEEPGSDTAVWRKRLAQILIIQMENEPSRVFSSFINAEGMVVERVENRNGQIVRAEDRELDNVSKEDYFEVGSKLHAGNIFVSNMEVRKRPPAGHMVYVLTPVIDAKGKRRGVFVVAINADLLVEGLRNIDARFRNVFPEADLVLLVADNTGQILYDIRKPENNFTKGAFDLVQLMRKSDGHYQLRDGRIGAYHKIFYNPVDKNKNEFWVINMAVSQDLKLKSDSALDQLSQ
ncbi:MAG: protein kinase [Gemmataceae bacterium]